MHTVLLVVVHTAVTYFPAGQTVHLLQGVKSQFPGVNASFQVSPSTQAPQMPLEELLHFESSP